MNVALTFLKRARTSQAQIIKTAITTIEPNSANVVKGIIAIGGKPVLDDQSIEGVANAIKSTVIATPAIPVITPGGASLPIRAQGQ